MAFIYDMLLNFLLFLCNAATPNTDYIPMSAMLTFPVGSIKWSTQCANVSIINNNDENFDRSLGLRASVISPSAAKFGGEAQSSTGTIEAIIVDDDGKTINCDTM